VQSIIEEDNGANIDIDMEVNGMDAELAGRRADEFSIAFIALTGAWTLGVMVGFYVILVTPVHGQAAAQLLASQQYHAEVSTGPGEPRSLGRELTGPGSGSVTSTVGSVDKSVGVTDADGTMVGTLESSEVSRPSVYFLFLSRCSPTWSVCCRCGEGDLGQGQDLNDETTDLALER